MLLKLVVLCTLSINLALSQKDEQDVKVVIGEEVELQSAKYPQRARLGTEQIWHLTADPDLSILVICDDISMGISEGCSSAYLEVDDGVRKERKCGSEPAFTFISDGNKMTVTISMLKNTGVVKCGATAMKPAPAPVDHPAEGEIDLAPGATYDKIYFQPMEPNVHKTWKFKTTEGNKISLVCKFRIFFKYSPDGSCNNNHIIVDGEKICYMREISWDQNFRELSRISKSNVLDFEIINLGKNAVIDCLAESVNGPNVHGFKNLGSEEIDSSEHGVTPGQVGTTCKCGWSNKRGSRIVNGKDASPGEYPWAAAMYSKKFGGHICGGSIISKHHVLTAAHCTVNNEQGDIIIKVGATNLKDEGQSFGVKLIRESRYDKFKLHVNDIAIITLDGEIKFGQDVGPVCLSPFLPKLDNKYLTVMGWGRLQSDSRDHPDVLQKAHLKGVNFNTCSYLWFRGMNTSDVNRVCAWASNKDSCQGDSGGPLVWLDPQTNRYTLVGVVSFGEGCNTEKPGVYTSVPYYYKWIASETSRYPPGTKTCRRLG